MWACGSVCMATSQGGASGLGGMWQGRKENQQGVAVRGVLQRVPMVGSKGSTPQDLRSGMQQRKGALLPGSHALLAKDHPMGCIAFPWSTDGGTRLVLAEPAMLLCPWNSPGKNTGVGCHALLQGIFLTQGLNLGLLHCRMQRMTTNWR